MTPDQEAVEASLMPLIGRAERDLGRLLQWVRAAESRIALVLPLATAMLGALAVLAPSCAKWTVVGGMGASFALVLLLLSIAFSALASFPRTTGPKGSLIFFGGITTRDLSQYEDAVRSQVSDAYLTDLIRQCHRNAQIAERKYAWIQRSMACLFLAALPWLLSLAILYSAQA